MGINSKYADKPRFRNHVPDALQAELAIARSVEMKPLKVGDRGFDDAINSGTIKWAVDTNGVLKIVPEFVGEAEMKHSVITDGEPVIAAGEADIIGRNGQYRIININNHSGHYRPSNASLQIGIDAFADAGIK